MKQSLYSADIKAIAEATAEQVYKLHDKILTLPELATKIGKSEGAIKKLVERGKLPVHRLDRTMYFSEKEITEYLLSK